MKRYAVQVEYLGCNYSGWQRQLELETVQGKVEFAFSKVADHPVEVQCAGRTDSGVHATRQIIHFDSGSERDLKSWLFGVNSNLPKDIRILWVQEVEDSFHARFSALSRTYRYIIYPRDVSSGVLGKRVTWVRSSLDVEAMHEAAQYLLGEQDFTSFRAANCQSSTPMRNVMRSSVFRHGKFIVFEIEGSAFLYHMVRNIVGTLFKVGLGDSEPLWVKDLLALKDRKQASPTAPADGLYLVDVRYPDECGLPVEEMGPDFIF